MRLLSYNIHKGIGGRDRRYKLDRICRVIEDVKPDLVCLQEVTRHAPRTNGHDQPHILTSHFKAHDSAFQMNVHYHTGGYGNLLMSRWPILRKHHLSLRHKERKPRGAQLAVVDTPEGSLHLANWHLGLREPERQWQAKHLLHHPLFRESSHLPTLIVGDSNDWRNKLAEAAFDEHEFDHATAVSSQFRSFPAFLPILSLDKAFHRGIVIRDAQIVREPLMRQASDHLPLVIDFNLFLGQKK